MAKNALVVKSNHLIEASYQLTLNEQRVILIAITKIHRQKPLCSDDIFSIHADDFSVYFDMDVNNAYQELIKVAERLYERTLVINQPDPDFPTLTKTKTRWISSIDYIPETGTLRLMFAQKIIPYLSMLKEQFTKYPLVSISSMSSIYAIRLYELLKQWDCIGKREVKLDWLRQQLEIENEYERMFDFKKYVIEPAITQINTHSDLQVSYTQRKTGRVVTHFIFVFTPKAVVKPKSSIKKKPPVGATINGVLKADIERLARAGESYDQAAERIKQQGLL
jgi:plasmid replication initiation protein